jgi:hypothetical protein
MTEAERNAVNLLFNMDSRKFLGIEHAKRFVRAMAGDTLDQDMVDRMAAALLDKCNNAPPAPLPPGVGTW